MSKPVQESGRGHWSTRVAFILAAAGSAIGLGNLWKFPYITGTNGGGAFVIIYLVCIAAVGIPIFIAELYVGSVSQKNAVEAFEKTHKKGTPWQGIGWMGVLSAFLILSFYSVVGGWVLDFEFRSLLNQFSGHGEKEIKGYLGGLFNNPWRIVFWHGIFMAATVGIVIGGVKQGIERWNRILMPTLLGILGLLFVRSMFLPGFGEALTFMFSFDVSKLNAAAVLEAVGHSFFTLSLGMGAIITYGSYLKSREGLSKTAFQVALADTGIALVAGVVIFTIVFSYGLDAGKGPTLMFQTLPVLFSKMSGGYFISVAFFLLVTFAALTSAVSLLEVVVSYWVDTRKKDRTKTALYAGGLIFLLGILCGLSFNVLGDFKIIGMTFFDLFDKFTTNIFLPGGGMLIALFFGWVLGPKAVNAVVGKSKKAKWFALGLLWSARIIAPAAVLIVLINGIMDW